jgi:hypothetical protein
VKGMFVKMEDEREESGSRRVNRRQESEGKMTVKMEDEGKKVEQSDK